ncbi:hypothetical protein KKJ01_18160 [Xenorhabdus bovienii]|uniref:Uncharacterized protein n=1 Tax=Xenorhabdus bovienii TaxID=40576 RepID=A0AAJ1JCH7_XENBV|nr:hypothetical protein [Xenorhabdus bovienii]MDE1480091.1 hypothetical protein [Xenorhabdus bovienii]MDE1491738.1 hypothetical protein [Xenorhabdus bovienii]MDE9511787.1 hypothetical protein [Xenorhabdus bovienii]MDE9523440.1 hypothetical protein [Xenorhabdus bovienii]
MNKVSFKNKSVMYFSLLTCAYPAYLIARESKKTELFIILISIFFYSLGYLLNMDILTLISQVILIFVIVFMYVFCFLFFINPIKNSNIKLIGIRSVSNKYFYLSLESEDKTDLLKLKKSTPLNMLWFFKYTDALVLYAKSKY